MTVFKNYLKIAKSYIPTILLYSAIFMAFAIVSSLNQQSTDTQYQTEKTKIAFITYDQSQLIKDFQNYIKDNATMVSIDQDETSLKDALFFRKVDFIMIVPENFTQDFINSKDVTIDTMQIPDAYSAIYSKNLMNKYLNTAKFYLQSGINVNDLSKYIQEDFNHKAVVHMNQEIENSQIDSLASYYNFSNYALLAIMITVISMIMISFQNENIKRRNLISSMSMKSLNLQLLLGNIMISFMIWFIYVVISFVLYFDSMLSMYGILYILNSLCFVIFINVLSFFISQMTSHREFISGISNVISLGSSFIAGAFVPQAYLSTFVLNIAKITPSYWFIYNNNKIATLTSFQWNDLKVIVLNMFIILLFALVFYVLILIKNTKRSYKMIK